MMDRESQHMFAAHSATGDTQKLKKICVPAARLVSPRQTQTQTQTPTADCWVTGFSLSLKRKHSSGSLRPTNGGLCIRARGTS